MPKQLNLDEMLDCAKEIGLPEAQVWAGQLEAIGTTMAAAIATKLGVQCGEATAEGVGFAGTCAPFFSAFDGQPCPEALDMFDPGGDWHPKDKTETTEPADA